MSVSSRACNGTGVFLALLLVATSVWASEKTDVKPAAPSPPPVVAAAQLQAIVDSLRVKLAVPETVTVTLVPNNPLRASVEPVRDGDGGFQISLEEPFAVKLSPDELRAVLAHELGHVWIYTHHPYLQTEAQANRVAMRLVPRETLETVYEKVWKGGVKGDVIRFFGPPSVAVQ